MNFPDVSTNSNLNKNILLLGYKRVSATKCGRLWQLMPEKIYDFVVFVPGQKMITHMTSSIASISYSCVFSVGHAHKYLLVAHTGLIWRCTVSLSKSSGALCLRN
jgi:hypothetical protein